MNYRVIFKVVRFQNFMATGNSWTEVILDADERNLLIGKNGSGKSQMIDAITFALYNKAFRDCNKPDLINTINDKDCKVELELQAMGVDYKIIRTQKHNTFEVWKNGESLSKTGTDDLQKLLENQIVKMNFKTFCQVVILGSTNYIPFMQLPPADRRQVNEALLDLQTFSVMNVLLKGKMSALEKDIRELVSEQSKIESNVQIIRNSLSRIEQDNSVQITLVQQEIADIENQIIFKTAERDGAVSQLEDLYKTTIDEKPLTARVLELSSLRGSLKQKSLSTGETIKFFNVHDVCPVCSQSIQPDHKASMIEGCQHTVNEVTEGLQKLATIEERVRVQIVQAQTTNQAIQKFVVAQRMLDGELRSLTNQKDGKLSQINRLSQPTSALSASQDDLITAEARLQQVTVIIDERKVQQAHNEVALSMLKDDGIKAVILSKYIPIINQQVNAYLAAMNFFVGFEMNEVFEVTFKSRFRDKFKYAMFSEGQKARIDLALMLTWRDVAKLKNSVSTNLLILDEVFDGSLDAEGSEELLQIFTALVGENVWVISHKDLYVEKFDKVYRFVLENNFSQMIEVR